MNAWWQTLTFLQKFFVLCAAPATLILLVQTALLLFGIGDGDGGADGLEIADVPDDPSGIDDGLGDGLSLFTIRGISAFFAVGGWTGLVMLNQKASIPLTLAVAAAAGFAALIGIAYLMKLVLKLQSEGNIQNENAVGHKAQVYVTIPAGLAGIGKVTLVLQERFVELDAVTSCGRDLKTGEMVLVSGMSDASTLLVEPLAISSEPAPSAF